MGRNGRGRNEEDTSPSGGSPSGPHPSKRSRQGEDMPLLECPDCGWDKVSTEADRCPQCGRPVRAGFGYALSEPPRGSGDVLRSDFEEEAADFLLAQPAQEQADGQARERPQTADEGGPADYDEKDLPLPLGDPLRIVRVLVVVSCILSALASLVSSLLMPERGVFALGAFLLVLPFFFALWRALPGRPTNAFYLRSFTNDRATLPIRQEVLRGLGGGFRLSGIRDPRRRWPALLRYFQSGLFALRYCSPRYMNLEAGDQWKARLWRSLGDARCAIIDVSQMTSFVAEEVELCHRCLGLERTLFVAHTEQQREEFLAENRLPASEQEKIQVAVWDRGRPAFRGQVRKFAAGLPAGAAGLQMEALHLTHWASVPDGPVKSREGLGWAEAVVGTLIAGVLFAVMPFFVVVAVSLLFFIPWVYFTFRYVVEVGNCPERYKALATFGFAYLWLGLGMAGGYLAVQKVRGGAARMAVSNNLKQIGIAFHGHHDDTGGLPPAAITDRDGKPLLSWRVAILPYLGEHDLYREFKLDEPWDGPNNKELLGRMPRVYAHPGVPTKEGHTHYRIFVGPRTMWPCSGRPVPYQPRRTNWPVGKDGLFCHPSRYNLRTIPDGTMDTILAVEAEEAVPWTKPEELEYDRDGPLPALGRRGDHFFQVVMFDGSVRGRSRKTDEQTLRWLIEPDDGNAIPRDD
jgi:hypothetical protein